MIFSGELSSGLIVFTLCMIGSVIIEINDQIKKLAAAMHETKS
jgi:hypothetical protein